MGRVVRTFFAFIASTFFGGLLLLSALGVALRFTIAEPQTVKTWLADSGLYESIVEEVGKNTTIQEANEDSLIQISSSEIVDSAQLAFPSSSLERDGEAAIDGMYGWFRGDTTGPEFRVDLSQEKNEFAKIMANTLEVKIAELPECTSAGRFSVQAFDPFKADCRPQGVDLTQEIANFETRIAQSGDFLSQTLYTGGDVQVSQNGQQVRIGSAFPWVQRVYSSLLWLPWVIVVLTLASGLTIIFFSTTRRKGVRRAASALLLTGISLLVSGLFLGTLLQNTVRTTIGTNESQKSITENIVNPLLDQIIEKTYSRYSIYFGSGYLAVAVFMYGGLVMTRGKKHGDAPAHPDHAHGYPPTEPVLQPQTKDAPLVLEQPQPQRPPQPQPQPLYPRPEPSSVPPLPAAQQPAAGQHTRPQRQVTRRPPMIQG